MTMSFNKYLKYRNKTYFKVGENYLVKTHYSLRVCGVKMEAEKIWADGSLSEMMHSVECVSVRELTGLKVTLKNYNDCVGSMNPRSLQNCDELNGLSGYVGVFWEKINRDILPSFWVNPNDLVLIN